LESSLGFVCDVQNDALEPGVDAWLKVDAESFGTAAVHRLERSERRFLRSAWSRLGDR